MAFVRIFCTVYEVRPDVAPGLGGSGTQKLLCLEPVSVFLIPYVAVEFGSQTVLCFEPGSGFLIEGLGLTLRFPFECLYSWDFRL